MQRRNFLKVSFALSTLGLVKPAFSSISSAISSTNLAFSQQNGIRQFVVTQTYDLKAPQGSKGKVNLWIPIPDDNAIQQVSKLSYDGTFDNAKLNTNNKYNAKMLFVEWADSTKPLKLTLEIQIKTQDWEALKNTNIKDWALPTENLILPEEVKPYLNATAHIPTDGLVKEKALEIIGDEQAPIKQARLIHDWVSYNMKRDNDVIGCGTGDVGEILKTKTLSGKCTDINSVFVALCRAVGIPAREVFGIRVGASKKLTQYSKTAFGGANEKGVAQISTWQHCRAMFYVAGFGWLPADPADVTKMRLTENTTNEDARVKAVNEYLFGNWEMNWIGFNHARDFSLYPEAEQGDVNNLGYPYAEVDGDPMNFYDPEVFSYTYSSQEV